MYPYTVECRASFNTGHIYVIYCMCTKYVSTHANACNYPRVGSFSLSGMSGETKRRGRAKVSLSLFLLSLFPSLSISLSRLWVKTGYDTAVSALRILQGARVSKVERAGKCRGGGERRGRMLMLVN